MHKIYCKVLGQTQPRILARPSTHTIGLEPGSFGVRIHYTVRSHTAAVLF